MVELLELRFCDIGKAPHFIVELFIQLLAFEENIVLGEIEHEPVIMILIFAIPFDVFCQVIIVDVRARLLFLAGKGSDNREADQK
jgi:hypothetical protein